MISENNSITQAELTKLEQENVDDLQEMLAYAPEKKGKRPYIDLAQKLTTEVQEGIITEGVLFNKATKKVYLPPVVFHPLFLGISRAYFENGKFKCGSQNAKLGFGIDSQENIVHCDQCVRNLWRRNGDGTPIGPDCQETREIFVYLPDHSDFGILRFQKSKVKIYDKIQEELVNFN